MSNNPDVEAIFSDTGTGTTTNLNANILAKATPGSKQVPWSNTEQGSSSVSASDGNKVITSSTLIAPNHDTQWSVEDTSAAVETWMVGEKLYAKENLIDTDGDGIADGADNCPIVSNPTQVDTDHEGIGDVCDNCPSVANPDQLDTNGDGIGNACEQGPAPVPEFPSTVLPATMIIGFLGAVLLIQRTREH
jgi:hypothetical protein